MYDEETLCKGMFQTTGIPKNVLQDTPWARRCNVKEKQFTPEYIRQRLYYEPDSGRVYYRMNYADMTWSALNAGTVASSPPDPNYYSSLELDGVRLLVHRVACALMLDEWPPFVVDHKSGVISDNTWGNLRPATHQQNAYNRKVDKRNRTGFLGVTWNGRCYVARAHNDDKRVVIGSYATAEAAAFAYDHVIVNLRGEFAKTNFSLNLIQENPFETVRFKSKTQKEEWDNRPLREKTNGWSYKSMRSTLAPF